MLKMGSPESVVLAALKSEVLGSDSWDDSKDWIFCGMEVTKEVMEKLHKKGLVDRVEKKDKRIYSLNEAGRNAVQRLAIGSESGLQNW